ncbi:hypothetical protein C1926_10920 [Stenotrophomonas sp. ZAC14A_NAIMI4_1]|nr:hypothetical protein C1926_10920 [Stenotrophomonas sp. ZAC14A_NAIMI4_1]
MGLPCGVRPRATPTQANRPDVRRWPSLASNEVDFYCRWTWVGDSGWVYWRTRPTGVGRQRQAVWTCRHAGSTLAWAGSQVPLGSEPLAAQRDLTPAFRRRCRSCTGRRA